MPAVLHFLGAPRRRNAGGVAKMQVIAALASLDPAGSPMCLHSSGFAGLADLGLVSVRVVPISLCSALDFYGVL